LLRYVFLDDHRQKRRDLEQPWDLVFHETKVGNEVTVVTAQNREIEGILEQVGSPSKDYDLLISNPKEVIRDSAGSVVSKRPLGNTSYHHYQDISRIEFDQDLIPEQETSFYLRQLQKIVGKKNEWYEKTNEIRMNFRERHNSDSNSGRELTGSDDAPSLELENSDTGDRE
jgi:hypothetical protein